MMRKGNTWQVTVWSIPIRASDEGTDLPTVGRRSGKEGDVDLLARYNKRFIDSRTPPCSRMVEKKRRRRRRKRKEAEKNKIKGIKKKE